MSKNLSKRRDENKMTEVNSTELREKLRNYLCAYWLRPETALWRVCDWLATKDFRFEKPILDLACGDGLNSYIRAGGTLPLEIDDSLSTKDVTPKEFFEDLVDIYNDSSKLLPECPPPPFKIDVGLDWKQDLLNKARKLNLYERLIQHDANLPLPLEDKYFKTIFSNSLYWMKNIDSILKELHRVLKDDGNIVLILANPNINKYNIYNMFKTKWSLCLDRGRHKHYQLLLKKEQWEKKFKKAGFNVNTIRPYMYLNMIMVHEIGLRPISPVLIKMANSLNPEKRKEIKKEWINYMVYLTLPLFEKGWLTKKAGDNCYYAVELAKS